MKKLTLLALLIASFNVGAALSSGTDSQGNQYYYSSFPMPKTTWKTKIAIKPFGSWQYTVAVPFYYYGDGINSDIIKLRTFLTNSKISFRDGVCTTFPYTIPCLR